MFQLLKKSPIFVVLSFLISGCSGLPTQPANRIIETPHFEVISKKANGLIDQYGEKVLWVIDLDNVLLVMDEDLGSEPWFDWQTEMIRTKDPVYRVTETFELLVQMNTPLLNRQKMHLTEAEIPFQMKAFQARGGDALVLTARSPDTKPGTLGSLKANGYRFEQSGVYKNWKGSRKFMNELAKNPREIEFSEGVIFSRGQDKGQTLRVFLQKAKKTYSAIVFVDNKISNSRAVFDAFTQEKVDLTVYRYSHEDPAIEAFKLKDKKAVMDDWTQFKSSLR
jgi:hypothetical protein